MRRRAFLKQGLVFTGLIWVPKPFAQDLGNPSELAIQKAASGGGGGGCATPRDVVNGTSTSLTTTGNYPWLAVKFNAGASTTICRAVLRLSKEGTPVGNLSVAIYSHNGGTNFPNASIDDSSTVAASTLAASESDFDFATGLSAAVTSGTDYWVVLKDSSGGGFSGNGAQWHYQGTASGRRTALSSDSGANWSEVSPDNPYKFQLYSA